MGKRKKGRMLLAAFSALLLTLGAAGMADTQYVEGKTQAKQIDVMFTHDTHSHLNSFTTLVDGEEAEVGGFARIKTLIDAQKESGGGA